jgi:hypothetical protein
MLGLSVEAMLTAPTTAAAAAAGTGTRFVKACSEKLM